MSKSLIAPLDTRLKVSRGDSFVEFKVDRLELRYWYDLLILVIFIFGALSPQLKSELRISHDESHMTLEVMFRFVLG